MATIEHISFEVPELVRILRGVDPAAFLVPSRVLRRVIKHDRGIGGVGLLVPHRKSYVIGRETLLRLVDRAELGAAANQEIPEHVILLAQPEPDRLAQSTIEQSLVKYWQMLFHARIDLAMEQKLHAGTLNAVTVRPRIQRLGAPQFDEIGFVMQQEKFVLPPETPKSIYAEFIAVYWTLKLFAKKQLPHFFPGLIGRSDVDALAAEEVDGDAVYSATRPPGAPDPDTLLGRGAKVDSPIWLSGPIQLGPAPSVGDSTIRRLETHARDMDARGNNVRAAILRTRAAEGANLTLAGARGELIRLCERLKPALELSDEETERWRKALLPLLVRASRGSWSLEARFLYDLQKVCVDAEKGIFTVDLVEWGLSLGQRPVRRSLPGHQAVAIVRHLRHALERLPNIRLANGDREELATLLGHAVECREHLMRERFRPLVAQAMDDVGLKPANVPEEIGQNKLIEELLDRVVEYGHLNFGILRDAISRNQLKLPDLKGPVELLLGDPLIRLNRKLGVALDGVYRRGEIYMRLLHRLSSVSFGTLFGRLLTLFVVLPFGLAYFTVVAPDLLVEEGEKLGRWIGILEKPPADLQVAPDDFIDPDEMGELQKQQPQAKGAPAGKHRDHSGHSGLEMPNLFLVGAVGVFYLFLFHVGSFRSGVFYGLGQVGRGLRTVFLHGPLWLLRLPPFRAIFNNPLWLLFRRVIFWPLALAAVGGWVGWMQGLEAAAYLGISGVSWVGGIVLFNSRIGRNLEETLNDWVTNVWLWFSTDFVPGLLRSIMDLSRWFLETVEQLLYTVDEWLRFKSDEGIASLIGKALLSVVWFAVTYLVRIYINLLIEPTVNPIKHFPVVTVGHKVMLPFLPVVGHFLYRGLHLDILGPIVGYSFVGMTIFFIPGICGFVVWELKENWKLYAANRSRHLKPQMIGSHGETMLRLLKPGFHSGTIPKLYRKLRRAERKNNRRAVRKAIAMLHHVEESVGHLVERELLALLRQSKGWNRLPIALGGVHLTTNRIAVELNCPECGPRPLVLAFDHQAGWLLGSVLDSGWLMKVTAEQRGTFAAALAGIYKMAGVHFTHEQIAASLGLVPGTVFDIDQQGLVVWTGPDYSKEVIYDLSSRPMLEPRLSKGLLPPGLPQWLDPARVLFSNVPISWRDWVWTWERDRGLVNGERRVLAYAVLP